MSSDISISVENLSKRYRIGLKEEQHDTFGSAIFSWLKSPQANFRRLRKLSRFHENEDSEDVLWALKDISFEIKAGEVIGIIGRNGAGKSTLLKILSRITEPTSGRAVINGRLSSLLEIGTGFHPDLTGRENIYLNGTILGMSRKEVAEKFDEIVEFSGVERFIDTPVKRYSSGMRVRLGFAVAAHLEPEILLIDEVLAVGDSGFQKKCLGKMDDISRSGRTVLFVSHQMASITALCSKCVLLNGGRVEQFGETKPIVEKYLQDFGGVKQNSIAERTDRKGDGLVKITDIRFLQAENGIPLELIMSGQDILIEVSYECADPSLKTIQDFRIELEFLANMGHFIMSLSSQMANDAFRDLPPNGKVYCRIPKFPLMTGLFHITSALIVNGIKVDILHSALTIHVESGDFFGTGKSKAYGRQGVYVPHYWTEGVMSPSLFRSGEAWRDS